MKAYLKLAEKFERINKLAGANAIIQWDFATMMPEGGANSRGDQIATISTVCHEMLISNETGDLLAQAEEKTADLDDWQRSNLRLMRREYKHATCVDSKLLEAFTKAGRTSEMVWRGAKVDADFKRFEPHLAEVLKLAREIASAKAEALGLSKYDALLDQYDEGRRSSEIDVIFGDLENFLPSFLQTVLEQQKQRPAFKEIDGLFPVETQKILAEKLMAKLGFDFNKGRLDTSSHPFCGGTADDVRITCRYNLSDFTQTLMNVTHETGHALYEMGLPAKYRNQPVGNSLGMSIHESQSLFVEMQLSRSFEFCSFMSPLAGEVLSFKSDTITPENLHRMANHVEKGFIRVDADEITYPLHVILRYKIEKALIEGEMEVSDIPHVWNNMMKKYLGLTVPSDREGCLQDIHWSDGSFGYFPTYTLGALSAAQFFRAMRKAIPDVMNQVKAGNFTHVLSWLRENIHSKGSLMTANELMVKVTGEPLNSEIFKEHLRNRYMS